MRAPTRAWCGTAAGLSWTSHRNPDAALPRRSCRVAPEGSAGTSLLLAQAGTPTQERAVGNQAGGRVAFFLHTSDFARTYERMRAGGVRFLEAPRTEPYGTVSVFADRYGNRWDLIEPRASPAGPARRVATRFPWRRLFGLR